MTRERVTQRVPQSDRDKATPRYRSQAERQSVRERKKTTGICQRWVKDSLGPPGPRPSSCSASGLGVGRVDNVGPRPRRNPRVTVITAVAVTR